MVHGAVQQWIESAGLQPGDVPKALGYLVGAKYMYAGAAMVVGIRYHPLRRLLLAKHELKSSSLQNHINKAVIVSKMRMNSAAGRLRDAKPRWSVSWPASMRQGSKELGPGTPGHIQTHNSAQRRLLKDASQKMLQQQQLQEQSRVAQDTWKAWASKKYWGMADRMESAAASSRVMSWLSLRLGFRPQCVALGAAEGVLLAKLAAPVTLPTTLLVIIAMMKQRNSTHPVRAEEHIRDAHKPQLEAE